MAHKYLYWGLLSVLGVMVLVSSCKTEHEDALSPYTEVESFSFENNNKTVDAVILGDSIVVYWLIYNTMPTTITPTINISKGATISPKSGEPVSFSETTIYTVTAEDGTEKKYKLKPQTNKPTPVISNIESNASTFISTEGVISHYYMGENLRIMGQYFLTGNTEDEISVSIKQISNSITRNLKIAEITDYRIVTENIPYGDVELDSGYYDVQILVKNELLTSDRIWIAPTPPNKIKDSFKSLVEPGGTTDEDGRIWFTFEADDYTMKYYPNPVSSWMRFYVTKNRTDTHYRSKCYDGVDFKKEGNRFSACVPKGVTGYVNMVEFTFKYYYTFRNKPAVVDQFTSFSYKDKKGLSNNVLIYGTPQ